MRLYGLRQAVWRSSFRQRRWEASHRSAPGYVYVMRGDGPALKIGSSTDPERRRRELQTGTPADLQILHAVPVYGDAVAVERDAQNMLSAHRVRLEWYDVPPDLAVGAIYAAAYRLGCLSPLLNAKTAVSSRTRLAIGVAAFIPFALLAGSNMPLTASLYLYATISVGLFLTIRHCAIRT